MSKAGTQRHTHLLLVVCVLAQLWQPAAVSAAGFTVTSTADRGDTNPGDGVCAAADGSCTVRAAIQEANALGGANTITIPAGRYIITIRGDDDASAAGDFDIAGTLTIVGAGSGSTLLDGGGEQTTAVDRVLHILADATATISNLSVQNGSKSLGGGVFNSGTLTLDNAAVVKNSADVGGGIQNTGTLTVTSSDISNNLAHFGGGGINNNERGLASMRGTALTTNAVDGRNVVFASQGGGIFNAGIMTIEDSQLAGNALAGDFTYGAGIGQNSGQLTIRNTRITQNVSAGLGQAYGGGIALRGGTLRIGGSTIDSNAAADRRPNDSEPDGVGGGGGLYSEDGVLTMTDSSIFNNITTGESSTASGAGILHNGGTATIAQTAITGNRSALDGGGLLVHTGTLTLTNTTVSSNQTARDGGGLLTRPEATSRLTNVTIATNSAGRAGDGIANAGATHLINTVITNGAGDKNCVLASPLTSEGHNLENADTCALRGVADRSGQDARLGPLQDNGGPTLTHALGAGSPAIDAGSSAPAVCPATDQRGVARPVGRSCDIGAYEAGGDVPVIGGGRVYLPFTQQ
ncbi:MAG: hypothetical protein H7Z42_22030 [Roseiflexaceae bacterium]|nr:hypothetical protein [Roseiflexaceae bacterium]